MESGGAVLRNPAWSLLRDLISDRTGIYFERDTLDLMAGKISDLMAEQNIDSPLDYYYLLKYEHAGGSEWSRLENAISVRETYFWRERDQFDALTNTVLPVLSRESAGPVRIWSAACATGEEPLTIAMALDRTGWFDRIAIKIHATDMSAAAICAAQRGIYRERSFRNTPEEVRNRYFRRVPDGWEADAGLRRRIQWRQANLTNKAAIADVASSHVIFCRNVFIYFSESAIRSVLKTYGELMPRPGYLFVGAAESLLKLTTQFQLQQIGGAFVYVRE